MRPPTIHSLHVVLFAGLAGKLFLGCGEVRRDRSPRVKWLDLHNLLGIVTLSWAFVVGATGVVNTWADLLLTYWRNDQLAAMTAPYRGLPLLRELGSLDKAVAAARAQEPHMKTGFIAFPGTAFSSAHHYGVLTRGDSPLTSRLFKPVLVDAATGEVTASRELPWYLSALLLSQPLHFGDHAGAPMQWLWALLDVITIVVLGSGVYLRLRTGGPR